MYQITRLIEPSRLRLVWQSINGPDRSKYVVGELVRAGASVALYYNYNSTDFSKAMSAGFRGHPAFDFRIAVHHDNVLPIFMKRVPPRSRSDFNVFLFKHGLSSYPNASDFALLGYSGGRLPGDGFSLEIDFSIETPPFQFFFEISGFRYYEGMQVDMGQLIGQPLYVLPEPSNPFDPNALQIYTGGVRLGYVPRTQVESFRTWLTYASVHTWIDRIEGTPIRPQVSVFTMVGPASAQLASITYGE